ncbi:MAG: hypothetical protein LBR89_01220 [Holosporales bacterium]|jgi:hypothetical protein|nr:hypothetical protein [Holosporales bacterium]
MKKIIAMALVAFSYTQAVSSEPPAPSRHPARTCTVDLPNGLSLVYPLDEIGYLTGDAVLCSRADPASDDLVGATILGLYPHSREGDSREGEG